MKKILIIVGSIVLAIGIALAIILPIVLGGGNPSDSYRSIKALEVEGNSTCIRDEKEIDIYEDMNFRNKDKIKTSNNSYLVLKLDADKYIYIGSNSSIELKTSERDSSLTTIRVNEGSIVTEVKNKLADLEEFEVETPNSTMAIRGTTFQVEVIKKDNEYEINYRLVEGLIDVKVLESKDNSISAGVFSMNPMEEIKIIAKDDGIIDSSNHLDDVIEKVKNNDSTIEVKNYDNVDDYISKTTKVILSMKKLSLSDIASILEKIRFNHEANMFRTIVLNSTFDVYNNNQLVKSNLVKYESDSEYSIKVTAQEKEEMMVSSWKKSTFNENGDLVSEVISGSSPLELNVNETMILEPLYQKLTSKSFSVLPSNGALCSIGDDDIDEEIVLEEGVITLTAYNQAGMIFMGWYEIDEDGNASLIDDRNLVLSDYNIGERIEEGIVSIQPRYITNSNVETINSIVRKAQNNTLVDSLIHFKSGTNFDSSEYIVEVSDGIYKATLQLSECSVSFTNGTSTFDPTTTQIEDGEYSFNVQLLENAPKTEIPLVVEPFTFTVYQPYVGTSITVNYYQEGIDGLQSVTLDNINEPNLVLENVISYTLTFNIGSFDGLFTGFYDQYDLATPLLIDDYYTHEGEINQKVVISTRVLPKTKQSSTDKLYLYVYDKEGNELSDINMPFGKKFSLSDYVFKVKYDTYYPDEVFEIPSSILMYSINDTVNNNNLSDSAINTVTNQYSNYRYDFCFYAKDGAGTFIQTYRYLKVLPDTSCFVVQNLNEPISCKLNGVEVPSSSLNELTSGIVTLTANQKEDYIFIGWIQSDDEGESTLLSENKTLNVNVEELMNSSIYAILPKYVDRYSCYIEFSETSSSNRIYEYDTYKLQSGEKFDLEDFNLKFVTNATGYDLSNYQILFYDEDDNLVDPINNVLSDGTYSAHIVIDNIDLFEFTLSITSFKLTVYNESNYKFKVVVDNVEYELAPDSTGEYSGTNIKVSPKENQDYFYGYLDYDTYEYNYDLEYDITLTKDKAIEARFVEYFEYNDLQLGIIDEEGYFSNVSEKLIAIGEEITFDELLYFSDYYGPIAIPDRIVSITNHSIYDSIENRTLLESEVELALNTPSSGRYYAVYEITSNIKTSIPIKVYNPNGYNLNILANSLATYDITYLTKDGETSLSEISSNQVIEGVISFEIKVTLTDYDNQVFAGWYSLKDGEYEFLSKYTNYELMIDGDFSIYALVVSSESGSAGILLKDNVFVTSYQGLYGYEPDPFTFAFKDTNDNLFVINNSVLKNQNNSNYYQICSNNSRYYEITAFNKVYSEGCFIIITIKNGTKEIDYKFTFTSVTEPDTFSPVSFVFGDESLDVDTITYYNETGTALLKTVTKDGVVVDSPSDITFASYNSRYSMIMYVNSSASFVDGTNVTFSILSEGYGLNGLATDMFSPRFFIVGSDKKIHLENEITDLANITIDTSTQRIVALADCLVSEGLNANREDYEYSIFSNTYNKGDHRAIEFNIFIQ